MSTTLVGWTEPFVILISDDALKLGQADRISDGDEDRIRHWRILGAVVEVEIWVAATGRDGP
jgi:hypothetical protein